MTKLSAEDKKRNGESEKLPMIIAGPCSAESFEQLERSIEPIHQSVNYIRAGIWKPRTRPGSFEGKGVEALNWLADLKEKYGFKTAVEVATPQHVALAHEHKVDMLWVGARTTVNPFAVSELAQALKGTQKPVFVKNPIHPELALWKGALERFIKANVSNLGVIHRGFHSYQPTPFRNVPLWQIPMELKSDFPELPLLCDPSHIGGDRAMIQNISQKALDLNFDGLMIETHYDPDNALSDAKQQITPKHLLEIIDQLECRSDNFSEKNYLDQMAIIREQIDQADQQLLDAVATRMDLVEKIGEIKKEHNVAIFQISRWKDILTSRPEWAEQLGLNRAFIEDMLRLLHQQSVKKQTEVFENQTSKTIEE